MTLAAYKRAQQEAQRFLETCKAYEQAHPTFAEIKYGMPCGDKYVGAMKRSSLDLTRALAEMRKP